MSNLNTKPVIFLAFANSASRPLPELETEFRNLTNALRAGEQNGLCDVHAEPYATRQLIFDTFADPRFKNRIAVFHYAGHASSYQLLLNDPDGGQAPTHASGLALYLGQQPNLQLVFLNGCATQPQVQALCDANVSAIIATATTIADNAAAIFSTRFYRALVGGSTIDVAFHAASAETLSGSDIMLRDLDAEGEPTARDTAPWNITYRQGAECVRDWNLPEAVNNPLFDLPPLPTLDLPESPFRYLNWYDRENAELFHGRGHEIRNLYARITNPDSAPILLFYGQSGVGKSSILDAGLRPRLDYSYRVQYYRRDPTLGLSGTYYHALRSMEIKASLEKDWRSIEIEIGRPVILILDQIEEVFTRPAKTHPRELEDFFDLLTHIFSNLDRRPRGRLLLSFRKEWIPEIERQLVDRKLPHTRLFVDRLDRAGIIEVVSAPQRFNRLVEKYGIRVEEGVAEAIANDLLQDKNSPLAPVFQILLTKMWIHAKKVNNDHPHFTTDLYNRLKRDGLLLDDFLNQQLAALEGWNPMVTTSGLVLDLLEYHTTSLGTAEHHTSVETNATYAHQIHMVWELVQRCKDLYLLAEPKANSSKGDANSNLAHDTLAPLIRDAFEKSVKPGQRARRILENRAQEWASEGHGSTLDERDLSTVEQGKSGMRDWTADECRLIQASRNERTRKQHEHDRQRHTRKLVSAGLWIAVFCSTVLSVIIVQQKDHAGRLASLAHIQELVEKANSGLESYPQRSTLLSVEAIKTSLRLGEELPAAEDALRRSLYLVPSSGLGPIDPTPPLLLGNDATKISGDSRWLVTSGYKSSTSQLWDLNSPNPAMSRRVLGGHSGPIKMVKMSRNSRWILTVGEGEKTARLWDLSSTYPIPQAHVLSGHGSEVDAVEFSPDSLWVVTKGSSDSSARLWDLRLPGPSEQSQELGSPNNPTTKFTFKNDHWLVTYEKEDTGFNLWDLRSTSLYRDDRVFNCSGSKVLALDINTSKNRVIAACSDARVLAWELESHNLSKSAREVGRSRDLFIMGRDEPEITQDDHRIIVKSKNGMKLLWDLRNKTPSLKPIVYNPFVERKWDPNFGVLTADRRWFVISDRKQNVHILNLDADNPTKSARIIGKYTDKFNAAAISPNNRWLVTLGDTNSDALLWDLMSPDPSSTRVVLGHKVHSILQVKFSHNSDWLFINETGAGSRLWPLTSTNTTRTGQLLRGHESEVVNVSFSEDNRWLVTRGQTDTTVRLWSLELPDPSQGGYALIEHEPMFKGKGTYFFNNRWNEDFHPAGFVPTGSYTEELYGYVHESFRIKSSIPPGNPSLSKIVAVSPDSHWLITKAIWTNTARLWDMTASEPARTGETLHGHTNAINTVTISANGKWALTVSEKDVTQLWNLQAGEPHKTGRTLGNRESPISHAIFSPNSRWIVTAHSDATLRIWDLETDNPTQQSRIVAKRIGATKHLSISRNSRWVMTDGIEEGSMHLWDLESTIPVEGVGRLGDAENQVKIMCISSDSRWAVTFSNDSLLRVWNLLSEDPTKNIRIIGTVESGGEASWIKATDHWITADTGLHGIRLWSLISKDSAHIESPRSDFGEGTAGVVFSSDNRWMLTTPELGNTVFLRNLTARGATSTQYLLDDSSDRLFTMAISPDSKWAVITRAGKDTAKIWDLTARDPAKTGRTLGPYGSPLKKVVFSSDGHWMIAIGDNDTHATLWDLRAPNPAHSGRVLAFHDNAIFDVTMSTDNRLAVTSSIDGTVRIWNLNSEDLVQQASRQVGRNLRKHEWKQYFPDHVCPKTFPMLYEDQTHCSADEMQVPGIHFYSWLKNITNLLPPQLTYIFPHQ